MTTTHNANLSRLAEALFRFSAGIDQALAPHIRQVAVDLAGAIAASDEKGIAQALGRAFGVVSLGKKVGIIAESDAEVIEAAIDRSKSLALPAKAVVSIAAPSVAEFAGIAKEGSVQEKSSDAEVAVEKKVEVQSTAPAQRMTPVPANVRPESRVSSAPVQQVSPSEAASASTAAERQSQIISAIRRNPNARMRDLLAALPGVSERTIRYDLERLVASGKIEREGVGGPATWYRVRVGVTTH